MTGSTENIDAVIPCSRALTGASLSRGAAVLFERDPDLAAILDRLGLPPLWGRRPGFSTLVRIILEQQVSLTAALAVHRKLAAHLGGITPKTIHEMTEAGLRAFGLTRQKSRYCFELASRILDGRLNLSQVARAPDPSGRQALLAVPGLGPWSVDIYYLMALRRPDIWPQGDLALASALRDVKHLPDFPTHDEQYAYAQSWKPWRSVATRILWSHYLNKQGRYTPPPSAKDAFSSTKRG